MIPSSPAPQPARRGAPVEGWGSPLDVSSGLPAASNPNPCPTALYQRMAAAVALRGHQYLSRFTAVMDCYDGSIPALRTLLQIAGTDDPFTAASTLKIFMPLWSEIPAEVKIEKPAGGVISKLAVPGLSGQPLREGGIYEVASPLDPTVRRWCKAQLLKKFLEAFYPERFSDPSLEIVSRRRERVGQATLEEGHPEQVRAATLPPEARSRTLRYRRELCEALQEAIQEFSVQYDRLLYDGRIVTSPGAPLRVAGDKGGQFLGWFARNEDSLPTEIRRAARMLSDPLVELSPEEERYMTQALLAYQSLHSFIRKDVAFQGIQSDLEEYNLLSPTAALKTAHAGIDRGLAAARDVLEKPGSEVRFSDVSVVLGAIPVEAFRVAYNDTTERPYRNEVGKALEFFKPLFMQDGKWREDSIGEAVPLQRLKGTLHWKALTRDDFAHVMHALMLRTLAPHPEQYFRAVPIREFRQMIHGVVVAYRKAMFLSAKLTEAGVETPNWESPNPLPDEVAQRIFRLGKFIPVEECSTHHGVELRALVSMGTAAQDSMSSLNRSVGRAEPHWRNLWQKHRTELAALAEAGLVSEQFLTVEPGKPKVLASIAKGLSELRLKPRASLQELLGNAELVMSSPLVKVNWEGRVDLRKAFFSSPEEKKIAALAAALPRVIAAEAQLSSTPAALAERLLRIEGREGGTGRSPLETAQFYFAEQLPPRGFELGVVRLVDQPGGQEYLQGEKDSPVQLLNPRLVDQLLRKIEHEYIRADQLPRGWCERARAIMSYAGLHALRSFGGEYRDLEASSTQTFTRARDMVPWGCFVHCELVHAVTAGAEVLEGRGPR